MTKVRARLRKTPLGLAIVIGFFVLGLIGPWVAPYDPLAIDLLHEYEPPSWTHLLGTPATMGIGHLERPVSTAHGSMRS